MLAVHTANDIRMCSKYVALFGLLILGTTFSKFITAVQILCSTVRLFGEWGEVWEKRERENKNDGRNCFLIGFIAVFFFSFPSRRGFCVWRCGSTHWVTVNWDMHDLCARLKRKWMTHFFAVALFVFILRSFYCIVFVMKSNIPFGHNVL